MHLHAPIRTYAVRHAPPPALHGHDLHAPRCDAEMIGRTHAPIRPRAPYTLLRAPYGGPRSMCGQRQDACWSCRCTSVREGVSQGTLTSQRGQMRRVGVEVGAACPVRGMISPSGHRCGRGRAGPHSPKPSKHHPVVPGGSLCGPGAWTRVGSK